MPNDVTYIHSGGQQTWHWADGRLQPGAAGTGAPVVAVIDVAEDMLTRQSVPRLRGRDRLAMRERRLQNEFPDTAWRTALSLGSASGAQSEELVLAGVQPAGAAATTLASLAEAGLLRGLYTPAMLVANWIVRARLPRRPVLVALATPAGLRLMFIDHGRPLLSRLAPWPADAADSGRVAQLCSEELARTVSYLQNVRWIERGKPTELWLWDPALTGLQDELLLPADLRLSPTPVVSRLPDPARGGLAALLAMAAARPPSAQLAPAAARMTWMATSARSALLALAGVIALGISVAAGVVALQSGDVAREAAVLNADAGSLETSSAELEQALVAAGIPPQRLAVALAVDDMLREAPVTLRDTFDLVGQALPTSGVLALEQLQLRRIDPGTTASLSPVGCTAAATDDVTAAAPRVAELGLEVRARPDAALTTRLTSLRDFDRGLGGAAGWRPINGLAQEALNTTLRLENTPSAAGDAVVASVCLAKEVS